MEEVLKYICWMRISTMTDVSYKWNVPKDAEYTEITSVFDNLHSIDAWEYESDDYVCAFLEVDEFQDKIGFTLDDTTEWLDVRYDTNFGDANIDDFDYGNGEILFKRSK